MASVSRLLHRICPQAQPWSETESPAIPSRSVDQVILSDVPEVALSNPRPVAPAVHTPSRLDQNRLEANVGNDSASRRRRPVKSCIPLRGQLTKPLESETVDEPRYVDEISG